MSGDIYMHCSQCGNEWFYTVHDVMDLEGDEYFKTTKRLETCSSCGKYGKHGDLEGPETLEDKLELEPILEYLKNSPKAKDVLEDWKYKYFFSEDSKES